MGKKRLLRSIINIGKRQRKAGSIIFYQKDIDELKGNRKEAFKILYKEFTQRIKDIREILIKMEIVLKAKEIFFREGEEIETKFEHIEIEGEK